MPRDIDPARNFTWRHEFTLPGVLDPPPTVRHPFLRQLHTTSMAPLPAGQRFNCDLARLHLAWVDPGTAAQDAALALVSHSYGLLYLGDQDALTAADLAIGPAHGGNSRTLIAWQEIAGGLLPVGTLTTGGGTDLDLFELFEVAAPATWPHVQNPNGPLQPGEVCRFGLHPVFDLLDRAADPATRQQVDFYRRLILRRLTSLCLEWLIAQDITIAYCVVGPHLLYFMRRCGMYVIPVPAAQPRDNAAVTRLRRQFARYWRPDDPPTRQPLPYQLTGIIRPVAELADLPADVANRPELITALA